MARQAGEFHIITEGVQISFTRVGETYKSVETPSGVKSRKVIEWEVWEIHPQYGESHSIIYVLPRTNRAQVIEQYFNPNQGIIY